jgi:hypothetical protein
MSINITFGTVSRTPSGQQAVRAWNGRSSARNRSACQVPPHAGISIIAGLTGIHAAIYIATSVGFWELGKFSVAYRCLRGEPPSATLRRENVGRLPLPRGSPFVLPSAVFA